jgi:hypothetical protein
MRWFELKVVVGALALTGGMFSPAMASAQTPLMVTVEDSGGSALQGAAVSDSAGTLLGRTDANGRAHCTVRGALRAACFRGGICG